MEQLLKGVAGIEVLSTDCPNLFVAAVPAPLANGSDEPTDITVLKQLQALGLRGMRAENHVWTIIWTFLYWNEIFAKIPEGYDEQMGEEFPHRMHDIPRDLFTPDFRLPRKDMIEARRKELTAKELPAELMAAMSLHGKKYTRLLEALPSTDLDDVKQVLQHTPKGSILLLLDRLWLNYNNNRSGLPDLCVWSPSPAFLEVKGPSDSLRANQLDWLRYLAGKCKLPTCVYCLGWTEKKVATLRNKFAGPKGHMVLSYGQSSSKFFKEVEEGVDRLGEVDRTGKGKDLQVTAKIPLASIGDALEVLEKVVRWKGASVTVKGRTADITAASPLRCFAKKYRQYAGTDYCVQSEWGYGEPAQFGCKRFSHEALERGDFSGYGYRDTEKGCFILDRSKIEQEVEARVEELGACPVFKPRKIKTAVSKLPEGVAPHAMPEWGWMDSDRNVWVWDDGKWVSRYGYKSFPGVEAMVGIQQVSKKEVREIKKRSQRREDVYEIVLDGGHRSVPPPVSQQKSHVPLLLAIMGLILFSMVAIGTCL